MVKKLVFNENPIFNVDVKYTKNEYLKLNKFHVHILLRHLIILIYALVFTILDVVLYTGMSNSLALILALFIIIITVIMLKLPNIYTEKGIKNGTLNTDIIVSYIVYSDRLEISTNQTSEIYVVKYSKLYRVYETREYFYLYIDKSNAYIFPKSKIAINIPKFRNVIKSNVRKKYKCIY